MQYIFFFLDLFATLIVKSLVNLINIINFKQGFKKKRRNLYYLKRISFIFRKWMIRPFKFFLLRPVMMSKKDSK